MTGLDRIAAAAALGLALCICPAAGAAAKRKPQAAAALSAGEEAALREAGRRGRLLYAYDQAAWHGTDEMMAKLPGAASKVGGWVVDGPAEAPELVFFDRNKADPHAVFVAQFRSGRLVSSRIPGAGADSELSPSRRSLIAARERAIGAFAEQRPEACASAPMNSVTLPPAEPGAPTLVYLLTPQTDRNAIPMGGHFMLPVAADGTVGAMRRFANSCLNMPLPKPGEGRPEALVVTHLRDLVPTEIHVFSSLVLRMPIAVGTQDGRIWWVSDGALGLLQGKRR